LSGAGVSPESGIPTFRGLNGLWRNYRIERLVLQTCQALEHSILNSFSQEDL